MLIVLCYFPWRLTRTPVLLPTTGHVIKLCLLPLVYRRHVFDLSVWVFPRTRYVIDTHWSFYVTCSSLWGKNWIKSRLMCCIMVSQSRTATSSAAQHAKPEITSANSRALFSHVFFSQLLIGPSKSRAVLCEVRTSVISMPTGQRSVVSAFAWRETSVLCVWLWFNGNCGPQWDSSRNCDFGREGAMSL
jgi:hypothetical protein